ncbi:nuclear transport factor 2 family protein [Biomphalaria pfeifferi]|uniref:Nuclear transport factor 2 family protein n=1 Tax=Biomphalaria pfeifferi TaxID=112525 RepID=A0AAD8ANE4_BIOPF|nr:nuclear transport factor 2 family protein [Biomphalaria pfeifferi]
MKSPTKPKPNGKPAMNSTQNEQSGYAGDTASAFFETLTKQGIQKAYKNYAAEDIRVLREGKMPFVGKTAWLGELKKDKSKVTIKKRTSFFGAADFAYTTNAYSAVKPDKTTENGNFVQVWKLKNGKWQIAFDIFLPSNQ